MATAINKTIMHKVWFVPMSYHELVRVDNDLVAKTATATFASYFNKDARDNGAQPLSHVSVILKDVEQADNSNFVTLVVQADGDLKDGKVV